MAAYSLAMWRKVRDDAGGTGVEPKLLYWCGQQAKPTVSEDCLRESLRYMRQRGYLTFTGDSRWGHYTLGPNTPEGEARSPARAPAPPRQNTRPGQVGACA
jgi:hypothetical protein